MVADRKQADFAARGSQEQHVADDLGEVVVANKTGVGELTKALLENVLHAGYLEFQAVDKYVCLVGRHQRVRGMLWVRGIDVVTPSQHCDWELRYSGVDCAAVLRIPDDEGVVLPKRGEEAVVRTERKPLNADLHALENCDGLLGQEVPENDGSFWGLLENGADLTGGNDVAAFRNCNGGDFHVMASQKLLLVLVVHIFKNEEATDIVNDCVFLTWVEVHSVLVLSIVTDRMFELEYFSWLLTAGVGHLLRAWMLHLGLNLKNN